MNEPLKSQITEHCQMIQRGVKPMSFLPIQSRYKHEAIEIINNNNLLFYFEWLYQGWDTVYIFKNSILMKLIKEIPNNPQTASEHALIGYLCGYNTDSICEFIKENCK